MGKKTRTYVSLLLLVLFVAFKSGTTMFVHVHTVDGVRVVHSHPYTNGHHSHSQAQFNAIACAAAVQMAGPGVGVAVPEPLCKLHMLASVCADQPIAARPVSLSGSRAPPSLF